ncbi:glycosyltransferase family 39 protein [uncultured Arsenicicoccus sp.]|uniref:ArnT family glycosyltransferase n=1 Tax=uncultured Arsenicicoccus sp. TaxID=491339 RepID=UPI0025930022|nr:glycosyltransferase family 39 protein [uncultured Arsenicicoccus sp.]
MTTSTLRRSARRLTAPRTAPHEKPTVARPDTERRAARLWRGPAEDPSWARPSLVILLCATAAFYLYDLTSSGWANAFYSAAAQAGGESWKAFFYGSSDAANAITVDKPPASLWAMALSVRVLGLSSFAILLPEVLMGVASVGVLYATVKRHFGAAAGLIAGATLALTPVATLMFRFNNPDALLVLLMTLGAWATVKAVDEGRARWLLAAGAFLGLGFLTKTLQVFLVVPALAAAYLLAADTTLGRRITHLVAAGAALVLSAGWWVAIVELVPASARPYIGGSQTNSFLELTFGYNGLGRLTGDETGSVGGGNGWGQTGLTRLFDAEIGGQISWLMPSALLLLVTGLVMRGRRPRTDGRRAQLIVWGGWLVVTALTFSFMAGIFHAYYTVALAPAVAAVVAIGATLAWERRDRFGMTTLSAATAIASAWSFVLLARSADFLPWLRWVVVVLGLAAALLLLVLDRIHASAVRVVAGAAVVAVLAGPAAYSAQTVTTAHTGSIVTAGPSTGSGMGGAGRPGGPGGAGGPAGAGRPGAAGAGGPGGMAGGMGGLLGASTPSTEVVSALSADADRYTWVAAAVGSQNAAGLQLATGQPVMALGGFNGTDPSPTLAQLQAYVASGQIHYLLASGGMGGSSTETSTTSQILAWAAASYQTVSIDGTTFYDLTQPLAAS